jgi:hypothetical protein
MKKNAMNRLKKLGFKKIPGTEPGFHMYELTPAKLQSFDENFKPQAAIKAHDQQPLTTKEYNKIKKTDYEPRTEKRASLQARKRTSLTNK